MDNFLLIFAAGILDRIRGHQWHFLNLRIIDKILYSWVIALLCGFGTEYNWFLAAFIAMYATGMSFGWGSVLGPYIRGRDTYNPDEKLEWWQVGIMARSVDAALIGRGILWALPLVPLAMYDERVWYAAVAIVIAFPFSLFMSVHFLFTKPEEERSIWSKHDIWGKNELVRGWMNGALVWLLVSAPFLFAM